MLLGCAFVYIRALMMGEVRNVMSLMWLFLTVRYLFLQFSGHLKYWNEKKKFY